MRTTMEKTKTKNLMDAIQQAIEQYDFVDIALDESEIKPTPALYQLAANAATAVFLAHYCAMINDIERNNRVS